MKKTALALTIICLLTTAEQTYAACKTEACRQAVAWKDGYTAIVLDDDITPQGYMAVLDAVKANKGTIAIEADGVLLGWIPKAAIARLRSTRSVRAVEYEAVPKPEAAVRNPNAIEALSFFNRVVSGEYEDVIESGLWIEGAPLTGCVVPKPRTKLVADAHDPSSDPHAGTLQPRPARGNVGDRPLTTTGRRGGNISPNWGWAEPFQNPDMRGRVSVQVFRLDSNGAVDPNLYTWTSADMHTSRDQVFGAFNFWANHAAARGITLSFRVNIVDTFSRYTRQYVPTGTKYEPITRSSTQDYLWINDALQARGYGATSVTMANVYDKNEEFNRAHKTDVYGTTYDRSFSVFIVYNPGSAPLVFANGMRAYAKEDGPFTMVMWNSGGWGPENLGKVLTHETGHIFWACDEYYDAASNTGCGSCSNCWFNVGPRNQVNRPDVTNGNCAKTDHRPDLCAVPRVYCMMDSPAQNALCPHTPGQIGW